MSQVNSSLVNEETRRKSTSTKMHKLLLYRTWVEARVVNIRVMTNPWEDLRLKGNLMRKANDFIVVMNAIRK